MRGLVVVVATAFLSTVISDEASEEPRRFWPVRTRRAWRELHRPLTDNRGFVGHGKFLELPSPRVLEASVNLPTVAVIGRLDNEKRPDLLDREPKYGQSPANRKDSEKCRLIRPTILVSLDFRRLLGDDHRQDTDCAGGKCRRTEGWQLAKPFYVEEPRWVEVETDYADSFVEEFPTKDPYVLSRGKKLLGGLGYQDNQDLDDQSRGPIERKRSRSANSNDQDSTTGNSEGKEYKGDLEVLDKSEDPFFLTRGKKNRPALDYDHYEEEEQQERKRSREVRAPSIRDKRSIDPGSHHNTIQHQNTLNIDPTRTKAMYPTKSILANDSGIEERDSWSVRSLISKLFKRNIKNNRFRGKRSEHRQSSEFSSNDKPGSDGNRLFLDPGELQRRNRHSDLFELLEEPFFISRGKKATTEALETGNPGSFRLENLFIGSSCDGEDCKEKFERSSRTKGPRDRRGTLDELLANYDPFYVARGKRPLFGGRMQRGNFRPEVEGRGSNEGIRGMFEPEELENRI